MKRVGADHSVRVHAVDYLDGSLYGHRLDSISLVLEPSTGVVIHITGRARTGRAVIQQRGCVVQKWVRTLSPASEFAVVILGAFGYFIFTSYAAHLQRSSYNLTDADLEYLIAHELIVGATLAIFLFARGWSLKRIGLAPTLKDTGVGFLLVAVNWIAWGTIWIVVAGFSPSTVQAAKEVTTIPAAPGTTFWIVALASLVNGTFEETFVCGYVITALKDRSTPWTAINISVGITLLYHLYQGPIGMMFVVLTSVSFGYWYAQTGRLWPPILAHAVIDFLALHP